MDKKPAIIHESNFNGFKDVDFFLRLHRHLPDEVCNDINILKCNYRKDKKPINIQNDYLKKLQKDPEFLKREKEIEEAVSVELNKNK